MLNIEDIGSGSDLVKLVGGVANLATEKAILYHTPIQENKTIEIWFPKSVAIIDPDDSILWVTRGFIEKKEAELDVHILLKEQFR